jgi:hypothetical protein
LQVDAGIAGGTEQGRIKATCEQPLGQPAVVARGEQLNRNSERLFRPGLEAGVVLELKVHELTAENADPKHRQVVAPVGTRAPPTGRCACCYNGRERQASSNAHSVSSRECGRSCRDAMIGRKGCPELAPELGGAQ